MHPALRTLENPNYRIFFFGQFLSIVGTWMQTIATSWMVYKLSGSAFLLALTAGAQQLPILFLAPIAGVLADRLDRRKLLIVTQALSAIQALTLAALTFAGWITVWHFIVLALCLGLINAFETSTRQAFILDMVGDKRELPNAIALNSLLFNSARFIGPSIAGIVLATVGEAWCFTINAISFLGILLAYLRIRVPAKTTAPSELHWLSDLREGVRYAFGFIGTQRLLILLMLLSIGSAPWQPLMPIFASETFAGDSRTFGFLIGAVGVGALAGTVFLALRKSVLGLGRTVAFTTLVAGAALALFAVSEILWLSLAALAVFGFGLISTVAGSNTLLQTIADEDKRGRVVSLYVMAFLGMSPIGNFIAGSLATHIGAHETLLACGLLICGASLWFTLGLPRWSEAIRIAHEQQEVVTRYPRQL
jgi:MFS family permease